MIYFSFDIETDGPVIAKNSMISFGVVKVEYGLKETFYGELKPISEHFVPDALKISGFSREKTLTFESPSVVMKRFEDWLKEVNPMMDKVMFCADNNGFDFAFFNWYSHTYLGKGLFGHSSFNLNSFYKGLTYDMRSNIRPLRKTKHTHNALDDAIGNAEAMLYIKENFDIKRFL